MNVKIFITCQKKIHTLCSKFISCLLKFFPSLHTLSASASSLAEEAAADLGTSPLGPELVLRLLLLDTLILAVADLAAVPVHVPHARPRAVLLCRADHVVGARGQTPSSSPRPGPTRGGGEPASAVAAAGVLPVQPGGVAAAAPAAIIVLLVLLVPPALLELGGHRPALARLAALGVDLSVRLLAVGVAVEGLAAGAGLAAVGVENVAVKARSLAVQLVVGAAVLGVPGPVRFPGRGLVDLWRLGPALE